MRAVLAGKILGLFSLGISCNAYAVPPVAPVIPSQQLTEGVTGSFSVPAFSDPDGDTLSYSYSGLPGWLSVYNPSVNPRYLLGTPPYGESGPNSNKTYWITATATDPQGERASKAFSLTVLQANGPPQRPESIPAQSVDEMQYFSYSVPVFPDPDGDTVSYSFAGLPSWLTVYNPASNPRYLYGRAPYSDSGPNVEKVYWITVTASDPHGASSSRAFSLTVHNVNAIPEAPEIPDHEVREGRWVQYAVPRFYDADGDVLSYSFEGLPSWLTVYNPMKNERFLNGRSPQLDPASFRRSEGLITVVARDPAGAAASTSFDVTVTKLMLLAAASRESLGDEQTRTSIFIDPDWYIWCQSPIKDNDGAYHLFYSRWRRDNPKAFNGWLFESEIARAVATKPEGPYTHVETVMHGRGGDAWDAAMVHNPSVRLFDGRYYLYYIGTRDGNNRSTDFQDYQYSQRIGVAVADRAEGPWTRFDQPLLEPQEGGAIHYYVTNPSVARGSDGRFLMLLKGKNANDDKQTIHGVAVADSPLGPFTILPDPLLTEAPAEDPFLWFDTVSQRFLAIFKDWTGQYTQSNGGLGLMESIDGATWSIAAEPGVALRELRWDDGTVTSLKNLERPHLFFGDCGSPTVLYAAAAEGDVFSGAQSFGVQIPLAGDCP